VTIGIGVVFGSPVELVKTESAVELVVVVKVLVPKSVKVAAVARVSTVAVAIAVVFELTAA
jgi:hypothetical protein